MCNTLLLLSFILTYVPSYHSISARYQNRVVLHHIETLSYHSISARSYTYDRRNGSVLQITLHGVSPSKNDGYQRHASVDNNCMVQKEKVYLKYTDDKIILDQVAAHFKYDHLYILRIFRHPRVNQRNHRTPTTKRLHSQTSSSFVLGRIKWTSIIYNSKP